MMRIFLWVFAFPCAFSLDHSDNFIREINNQQNLWTAGRNFHENISLSVIRSLFGTTKLTEYHQESIPVIIHDVEDNVDVPESFDARMHWPKCKTIREVTDQSACRSDWAVSVASAISDRICIQSEGKRKSDISARNILACDTVSFGCDFGHPHHAWMYWHNHGIVTGGPYGSDLGCQPYPFYECDHYNTDSATACPDKIFPDPNCYGFCDTSKIKFKDDLTYGLGPYRVSPTERQIQEEIMKNGPVVGVLMVYSDFIHYKKGVYNRTSSDYRNYIENHAVKIIGWGIENNTKYWLAVNSWNKHWGDKGFFKVLRGVDHCGIETEIYAGLPK